MLTKEINRVCFTFFFFHCFFYNNVFCGDSIVGLLISLDTYMHQIVERIGNGGRVGVLVDRFLVKIEKKFQF